MQGELAIGTANIACHCESGLHPLSNPSFFLHYTSAARSEQRTGLSILGRNQGRGCSSTNPAKRRSFMMSIKMIVLHTSAFFSSTVTRQATLQMPKPAEVMIAVPVYQQHQYEVAKFLKIKPAALGILEIFISLLGLGLTIWNVHYSLLWSPVSFFLTGALTVSAANSHKPCMVRCSQILSYLNAVTAVISVHFHFFVRGVTCFLLLACDIMIFIFSMAVALTFCPCCCNPKSRQAMVSYVNQSDLPVNHIVLTSQQDSSAMAQSFSSALYVQQPLPNYSPVPRTPPPPYSQVPAAHPRNCGPNPSTPPPAYETR